MHEISALNGCVGCAPSGIGYPARIYGAPFNGLGFESGPLKTAMLVIGVLVVSGIVFTAMAGKKRKTA